MGYGGFEMGFFWYAGYEFQKVGEKSGMRDWETPTFTPTKEYNCHICEKKLSSKQMLNVHIDKIHKIKSEKVEEKHDFSCQICKKDFKTSFSLKRHKLAVHNFEKNDKKLILAAISSS